MDINDFIERLNSTTNTILQIAKSCSLEQLHFKQGNSWSILEILEHLYLTDRIIYTIISRPSSDMNSSAEIIGNDKIKRLIVEQRNQRKVITPEILKPKGEMKDLITFENAFLVERETLKENLTTGKIVVDNRIHKHPVLNEMTITDWLNFTVHHSQRHIEQIKDILKIQLLNKNA